MRRSLLVKRHPGGIKQWSCCRPSITNLICKLTAFPLLQLGKKTKKNQIFRVQLDSTILLAFGSRSFVTTHNKVKEHLVCSSINISNGFCNVFIQCFTATYIFFVPSEQMFHQFLKTQRPLLLHAKQLGNGSLLFYFCPKWLRGVCKQMLLVCSYQSWIHIGISWLHRCLFGSCSGSICSRQHDGIDFFWQPQRTTNKNKLLQKSFLKLINSRFAIEFVKVSIRKKTSRICTSDLYPRLSWKDLCCWLASMSIFWQGTF